MGPVQSGYMSLRGCRESEQSLWVVLTPASKQAGQRWNCAQGRDDSSDAWFIVGRRARFDHQPGGRPLTKIARPCNAETRKLRTASRATRLVIADMQHLYRKAECVGPTDKQLWISASTSTCDARWPWVRRLCATSMNLVACLVSGGAREATMCSSSQSDAQTKGSRHWTFYERGTHC